MQIYKLAMFEHFLCNLRYILRQFNYANLTEKEHYSFHATQ